jgi:hypothetical protein
MKFRIAAVIASAFLLSSCHQRPVVDTQMGVSVPAAGNTSRVQVTRVGVIPDNLAYGGVRGLYVIRDTETGREFIGVSGVGITEVGSHNQGKSTVDDER